jgi:putative SOS response-associated peptidase YedK
LPWRVFGNPVPKWANLYSMIMAQAARAAVTVHSRMPVLLASADHALWLEQEMPYAINLCGPGWAAINRTESL